MNIKMYIVDAFTNMPFKGNTCAVCIFPEWPDDVTLQNIARQNLFAETAFIVPHNENYPELRWFTVSQEVDFCGYGTLSAGYVYLTSIATKQSHVTFSTRNYGLLPVTRNDDFYQIEVPVTLPREQLFNDDVYAALGGAHPETMLNSERGDLLVVYSKEVDIRVIVPDFLKLMETGYYGYILTSQGDSADYTYRYFSPRMTNVWEDPVNGGSQSVLAPFWANKLRKSKLHGQAASQRGGDIYCEYNEGNTVKIGGSVSPYLKGELTL